MRVVAERVAGGSVAAVSCSVVVESGIGDSRRRRSVVGWSAGVWVWPAVAMALLLAMVAGEWWWVVLSVGDEKCGR